jgi:hypothetical protein
MAATSYATADYELRRQEERWQRIDQINGDVPAFDAFVDRPGDSRHQAFGAYAMEQVKRVAPEVRAEVGALSGPGAFLIYLDLGPQQNFISLKKRMADDVLVWSCWKSEADRKAHELDALGCLKQLAALAQGTRRGVRLALATQEDAAFMWKAPSVHPLQVLENDFQRIVHRATREATGDPLKAQSATLARFFTQAAAGPEGFRHVPLEPYGGEHLAAVHMNHLVETYYLFRLLVRYRVESDRVIDEALRADLSSNLTRLLHNGDRAAMGWISSWLTRKIAELGALIRDLNRDGQQRAIFFLKGGRALNFYLGTPEKGENDWDTQVVINPHLSAEDWYRTFAEVHDVLLVALERFKIEFTALVKQNQSAFAGYVEATAGPRGEDDEDDEAERGDVSSLREQASCKAELIDIGIPRRDSPSGLEEWTRLSAPGAREEAGGVIYPHRQYYLNEYLMMIRDAFLPGADAHKAPKRIARFGLVLAKDDGAAPPQLAARRFAALPAAAKRTAALDTRARRELYALILDQFVEAYNLHQDGELAGHVDREVDALIARPPALPAALADVLDAAQRVTATDVGVAHALSARMDAHFAARHAFFERNGEFFAALLADLARRTQDGLRRERAQFAIAGSYAARAHARHLRMRTQGLEPIRRVLVKLQCARGADRGAVLGVARAALAATPVARGRVTVAEVNAGAKHSLLLYWSEPVEIGDFRYRPLVMKIRVAEQKGEQLPVLAAVEGLPLLDLRYIVADYRRKTSKIDEQGSRRVLAAAAAAAAEMLSQFEFDSDEDD